MHANAISAIIFFILVLSNVASKLLRTNLPLNKAKPSKNSNLHLLFPDSRNLTQRREGAEEGKTKVFSAFAPLRLCVYFPLSNFELLSDARIKHRALRRAVLRLRIVRLRVILDLLA